MGSPTCVKFSRIGGEVFEAMHRLQETLYEPFRSTLREAVRLRPSGEAYDGGLELAGPIEPCDSLEKAQRIVEGASSFALVFLAHQIPAEFYLYLYDFRADSFGLTLTIESSIIYYRNDDRPSGQWLEALLTATVCTLKPFVCGYGRDAAYELKHEPLDPAVLMARLRSGELLSLPRPIFHAISTSLIESTEIESMIKLHKPTPDPEYRIAPGYHLLGRVGL
jgi:hypothetical protein